MEWRVNWNRGILLLVLLAAREVGASVDTIGPNGINSIDLGLTGTGASIGQVEAQRPGLPNVDNASNSNFGTIPEAVFIEDGNVAPTPNSMAEIFDDSIPPIAHATLVAGVMIGTDPFAPGVAPDADLYASAGDVPGVGMPGMLVDQKLAVSAQHIATRANGDVSAINLSFNIDFGPFGGSPNGNSLLTQFIDWSAQQHNVLYVVAGRDTQAALDVVVPTDNFNGMTVAASAKAGDGVYRRVAALNAYNVSLTGNRTAIDILAPGISIEVADVGGPVPPTIESGTSFAAPHVAGTVALLQEHALVEMPANPNALRHEVMKAVLMNSADKIEGILGMERTVLKQNGTDTWFDSNAHTNPDIPLDIEMGAGHLNAKRALDQFSPGEHGPGSVPLVGWNYGFIDDVEPNKYVFDQPLDAGDYVSVTLTWDREWILDAFAPPFDEYKPGDQFINDFLENLDLHLLPAGSTNVNQAIWSSTSSEQNVEHIFAEIQTAGNYEFWVQWDDPGFGFPAQFYGLAWWAGAVVEPPATPGDYDGNGSVGPEDFGIWKSQFGAVVDAGTGADGNGDGIVDAADYTVWRDNLSTMAGAGSSIAVPEPSSSVLLALSTALAVKARRRYS